MIVGQTAPVMVPLFPRFWAKVELAENGECWEWTGARDKNTGYGRVKYKDKIPLSHRLAYEAFQGPIPAGLQIDHLCRNRWCCYPGHLEAVTRRENILRGEGPTALNALKTHCPAGHPLTPDNLVPRARRKNYRECLTCHRVREAERKRLWRLSVGMKPRA